MLIEAIDLVKNFHSKRAVDGVSLAVAAGEIYGLVGPDGAGKTTTMRLLCAALKPDSGLARIGGIDITRRPEEGRTLIGYLPQRFALYEEMSVLENLRFFAEVRGIEAVEWKPRSLEILSFVGLGEFVNRRAGQLSGGMKQKLGLAVALVNRPRVLLLDEPTTGVDPVTRQDFWQLIIRLAAAGETAILVSTPYMDEAARCLRLGFMKQGRLVLSGTPLELQALLDGRILEVRGSPLMDLRKVAAGIAGVEDAQMFGDRLHLRIQAGEAEGVGKRLKHALRGSQTSLETLQPVQAGLEDVFIASSQ